MILSIVAAVARNKVIGNLGHLPWRLSADMKFFRNLTYGHHVIMGRKTFESLGKPLEGRVNVVVTKNKNLHLDGALVKYSFEEAVALCRSVKEHEAFVIGGSEIYHLALPQAGRLYLTLVDTQPTGDAFFPEWNLDEWELMSSQPFSSDEKNQYPFSINTYDRKVIS